MSASASNSQPTTNTQSQQQSTQGASGNQSPTTTVTAGGSVNYNDPELQLETVQELGQVVQGVLSQAGATNAGALNSLNQTQAAIAQQEAQQSTNNDDLLQTVLSSESQLAEAQGTGGASLSYSSNNYIIWGAVAIAIAALLALTFRK